MAIKKKYRLKKRIKNFIVFYSFICILFVASYTLSRYVETSTETGGIDIAKFNVSVNDKNVIDGKPFILNYKEISNLSKKIVPNATGFFEFVINPEETEVSLEYVLTFDLSELDSDFKLTYFTVNDLEEHYDITDGKTIKGDILLPSSEHGFTSEDITTIKVYWNWEEKEDIINPDINDYENKNIDVIALVKQKLK